jgi:hypothetical protein
MKNEDNLMAVSNELLAIQKRLAPHNATVNVILLPFSHPIAATADKKESYANKLNYFLGMNQLKVIDFSNKLNSATGNFQWLDNRHLSVAGQKTLADFIEEKTK